MKIKIHLSRNILEIADELLDGMAEDEREEYLIEQIRTWASRRGDYWYEEEPNDNQD